MSKHEVQSKIFPWHFAFKYLIVDLGFCVYVCVCVCGGVHEPSPLTEELLTVDHVLRRVIIFNGGVPGFACINVYVLYPETRRRQTH